MFDEDFIWFLTILLLNVHIMMVRDRVIDLEEKVEELTSYCEVTENEEISISN